jgi:hypothetical protein
MRRNPKQVGSNVWGCIPQEGLCPNKCNQCYFNRPNAFWTKTPYAPDPEDVEDKIVRVNTGHDSNIQRERVIEVAKRYKHYFFNTSIPRLDFPGPVVLTANPREEDCCNMPGEVIGSLSRLMFVRLRVSASNLFVIEQAVEWWTREQVPVVLTFMAYYEEPVVEKVYDYAVTRNHSLVEHFSCGTGMMAQSMLYQYKTRHVNSYWCPTKEFIQYTLKQMKRVGGRLVTMCGTPDSNYCHDCRNCEIYYWQTIKHMQERKGNSYENAKRG